MKTNLHRKIASVGLLALLAVAGLGVLPKSTKAAYYGDYMHRRMYDRDDYMRYRNPFNRYLGNVTYRYPYTSSYFGGGFMYPRNVIVVDRNNINNRIFLSNTLTGPGSTNVNTVTLTVNHDAFNQIANTTNITRNVAVSVNTGNNTVSMNTVVGNISTGDVDIDVF